MGNTPSNQASPARGGNAQVKGMSPQLSQSSPPSHPPTAISSDNGNRPNLRLPLPQRPTNLAEANNNTSNPTSPSGLPGGRGGSPRRRKSLELPDLNKLSFTPAAPVPTLATHTSHHLAPSTPAAAGHFKRGSTGSAAIPTGDDGSPSRRWRMSLGGKKNAGLSAMTKMEVSQSVPAPRTAPIDMPSASASSSTAAKDPTNPYFPATSPPKGDIGNKAVSLAASPEQRGRTVNRAPIAPIAIPGKKVLSPSPGDTPPAPAPAPPAQASPSRPQETLTIPEEDSAGLDDLVSVPIRWEGGGKSVYVTSDFADNWKKRIKLNKTDTGFETTLRLPPGEYRLKFLVDESWRCSKDIATATDHDGTLVNWIEVETPKADGKTEWVDTKPEPKRAESDDAQWTTTIPAPLWLYQYLEELPSTMTSEQWSQHYQNVPHLTSVPQPPTLPRHLDKVIINSDAKKVVDEMASGASTPAGTDDNSILTVPNHVQLNHLTASAIKNGTLGVGTTTRYRKKYITTMYFKPTLGDLQGPK